jgi:hypothetical protein
MRAIENEGHYDENEGYYAESEVCVLDNDGLSFIKTKNKNLTEYGFCY